MIFESGDEVVVGAVVFHGVVVGALVVDSVVVNSVVVDSVVVGFVVVDSVEIFSRFTSDSEVIEDEHSSSSEPSKHWVIPSHLPSIFIQAPYVHLNPYIGHLQCKILILVY